MSDATFIAGIAACAFVFALGWRLLMIGLSMRVHGNPWDKPNL
jgi:hypothetical protein